MEPTQPPVQWIPGSKEAGGLKLTTNFYKLLSSAEVENSGAVPPLPI
jgi:hypothetical protein